MDEVPIFHEKLVQACAQWSMQNIEKVLDEAAQKHVLKDVLLHYNPYGQTCGHLLIEQNYSTALETLLNAGLSVDAKDKYGNTLLHWAGYHGRYFIAKLLIDRGAVVDSKNKKKSSPLQMAVSGNTVSYSLIICLIEAGAEIESKNKYETGVIDGLRSNLSFIKSNNYTNIVKFLTNIYDPRFL